jgi:hypothetical protein
MTLAYVEASNSFTDKGLQRCHSENSAWFHGTYLAHVWLLSYRMLLIEDCPTINHTVL